MPEPLPLDRSSLLIGRDLRHAALVLLDRAGPASIKDILDALARAGFRVRGENPRKVLSDAMRVEVRRGRARRVGWGRYALGRLAPTTRRRIARRWQEAAGAEMDDAAYAAKQRELVREIHRPLVLSGDPARDRVLLTHHRTRWRNGQALRRALLDHARRRRLQARAMSGAPDARSG